MASSRATDGRHMQPDSYDSGLVQTYLASAMQSASEARSAANDPALAALATAVESIALALLYREGGDL